MSGLLLPKGEINTRIFHPFLSEIKKKNYYGKKETTKRVTPLIDSLRVYIYIYIPLHE